MPARSRSNTERIIKKWKRAKNNEIKSEKEFINSCKENSYERFGETNVTFLNAPKDVLLKVVRFIPGRLVKVRTFIYSN